MFVGRARGHLETHRGRVLATAYSANVIDILRVDVNLSVRSQICSTRMSRTSQAKSGYWGQAEAFTARAKQRD
jgi:hypothetical protein